MSQLRPARGTHDLLARSCAAPPSRRDGRRIARRYGYGEIATPIFEFTEVFARTLGETSDIVTKEMYTFEDRGGERITLRPENTAGVVRALIAGGSPQELPQLFYYAARCSATSGRKRAACASSTRSASSCWARPSPWPTSR